MIDISKIKVIAFDADDTLWENEFFFRNAEDEVAKLLAPYEVEHMVKKEIYAMEMKNLPIYGYGIKGFVLSMVEVANKVSNGQAKGDITNKILEIGKSMLDAPVTLLPHIQTCLKTLSTKYPLIVITKGDLLDQQQKLKKSKLLGYFQDTIVVSDKKSEDYALVFKKLEVDPESVLMIGNSLKSDILPVLALGAQAIHIPFQTTWVHEQAEPEDHHTYMELEHLGQLLDWL